MGRPVYEVLAVAGRPAAASGDPLRSAVDRLLERADAQEARGSAADLPVGPPRQAAPPRRPAPATGATAGRPVPEGTARRPVTSPEETARRPVAVPGAAPQRQARSERPRRVPGAGGSVVDRVDPVERERPPRQTDLAPRPELEGPRPERAPRRPAGDGARTPGWSRAGLARIGVPAAVLNALPRDAPSDDLGWLVSVTAAIAACVGPPAAAGPEHPVVVDGFGLSGVLGILEAGCRGATPGRISYAGRTTDATALELALVLHASLTGR
jgi:hypothetical protein